MNDDHEILARNLLWKQDGAAAASVTLEAVTTGMSEAVVYRATRNGHLSRYVKVAVDTAAPALRDEIARTQWLAAHGMSVPLLLRIEDRDDGLAVLMADMAGQPADFSTLPTPRLIAALAQAVTALHALPPAECPFDETLDTRLRRAKLSVDAGDIDPADFEPGNRGTAPAGLLHRLRAARPVEDIVVVHGDAMLNNIMIGEDGAVGFIDCGNAGRGDRYVDLALLHADIVAHRGEAAGEQFLAAYGGHPWDAETARYFLDLYELF